MIKKKNLKKLFILLLPFILLTISHATIATQSSTGYGGTADKAIDGNTDGNYWHYSVTHTLGNTYYDWILIDLESIKAINSITLWNRTDCCSWRLRNVRIMLSTTPFTPTTTASGLQNARNISVWEDRAPNDTNGITEIPFNPNGIHARYILIQKTGPSYNYSNYLSLAEVQVDANDLLEVKDMNFTIIKDTSVSFALTATNPDNVTSYPIFSSPTHGSLSGPENNITYRPDTNYTGIDTFTYKAYDGTNYSNEGTVTITVVPPATAVHDEYNTTYNTQIDGNLLDNDLGLNIELDIELIDSNSTPHGSLDINRDGSFTYLPDPYFDGNETFSYTIRDELNNTSTTTVTIVIYPPRADLSIVKSAPSQTNTNEAIDYTLTIQSDPSTQYITASNVRVIDHLPPGVLYSGFSAPLEWTCSHKVGTVTCDASNIPRGYNRTIIIHAFTPNILDDITNTAEVGSDTIDPDLSNNTSSVTTSIRAKAVELSMTKTVSSPTVKKTEAFSYTLQVNNTGSDDTTGVVVTDELNDTLGFISIDGGTDWSCSQGLSIECSYIANGGVLVSGTTPSPIIINVRAPATVETITNIAEVHSDTIEVNTANNTASVDVNITDGNIETGAQSLTKYLQYNLSGDMKLIGNANLNKLPEDFDQDYNDRIHMHYIDTDNDSNTFNSSSSTLTLDSSHKIKWAGLYWEGHICSDTLGGASNGTGTGCDFSNSTVANYNTALNSVGTIKLKTPNSSTYQTITANKTSIIPLQSYFPHSFYTAFADITNILATNGNGVYTVANIVATEGQVELGNYGGWTILVIYEDSNQTVQYKNITVFNGFQSIRKDNNDLSIDGFLTPKTGELNASIAFFTGDGDPVVGGVARMREGNTNTFRPIGDSLNPVDNLFNSTMTELGNYINPGITKTYGVDANRIDVSDFMVNNQTNTAFKLDIHTPTGGVDIYTISMFAFATDLTSPLIDNFSKSAVIIDRDGTRRTAAPNEPIYPGSSLEYTITFTNTGDEVAEAVEIFDDFDIDGLSQALDNYHFDTTQLKLFNGTTTNDEVNNADCHYDIPDHRVSCKISSVDIDQSFTMQFIVHVKEDLDASLFNTHARNTAYAKYRNPNGNTYVKKYTTPITNEKVGGKSNGLNAGTFKPNTPPDEDYISIDAINNNYNYAQDRNITTKIVNRPFSIELVHLNSNLNNTPYQAWQYNKPMPVLITLDDNATIAPPLNDPSIALFYQGDKDITVSGLNLTHAHRDKRFKLLYLDWAKILSWAPANSVCIKNPDRSVNLSGMPACFNHYRYVEEIFNPNDYPAVAKCYGSGIPKGKNAACDPLAYSTGGNNANGNISPTVYNHSFGCYQCIAESLPHFQHYSTDNFAARPDYFVFKSTNHSFPDLLRSGHDYNLSLEALDGKDNNTSDYNTTSSTLRMDPPTLDPLNKLSDSITLEGNTTLRPIDINITNGTSKDKDGNLIDALGFTFNNVGEVAVNIYDPAWANIDADDTPRDCNATAESKYHVAIEGVRSICGSVNTRFIPHHFALTSKLENHRNGSFTYYANNLKAMSSHVGLSIKAENEQNQTTTNFKQDAYDHAIAIDLNITDENTTQNRPHHLTLKKQVPNSTNPLGFGKPAYANGTYTIETNSSTPIDKQILFNYDRTYRIPQNPNSIKGTDVNTTIIARYESEVAQEAKAKISGTTLADGNATFYYARVEPEKRNYPNVIKNNQNTPIHIEVYCYFNPLDFEKCKQLGINTIDGETHGDNKEKWWLALKHDTNLGDGNVTLNVSSDNAVITPTSINVPYNTGKQDNVNVKLGAPGITINRKRKKYIVTIDLDTNATSPWLIHNPDSPLPPLEVARSPLETLIFPKLKDNGDGNGTGGSSWTGYGETGHVVDANASTRTNNKRLGW